MPVLEDSYPTTEITLPGSGAKVKVKENYSLKEDIELGNETDGAKRSVLMVLYAIKDWDYTDRAGVKLPITGDTIQTIPTLDGQAIMRWITKRAEKRNAVAAADVTESVAHEAPAADTVEMLETTVDNG